VAVSYAATGCTFTKSARAKSGGKYPNQAFTAFILAGSAPQFTDAAKYEGRAVAVSGQIKLYKGKPEIIVNSTSQISVK